MLLTILIFLAILGLLVFVHELGHFAVARRFGVKAEEFGFGFPPRLIGAQKLSAGQPPAASHWKIIRGRGEPVYTPAEAAMAKDTIYSLNWVPLGGFVKIKGENGYSQDQDSFTAKSAWRRGAILAAGVSMNLALAAVLFVIGYSIGMPQNLDNIGPGAKIADARIHVAGVWPDSPAAAAGVKPNDIIVAVNGQSMLKSEVLQALTADHLGQALEYEFKRGEKTFKKTIVPEKSEKTKDTPGIGIAIAEIGTVSYPIYLALGEGLRQTVLLLGAIISAFYDLLKNIFLGHGVTAEVAGPIGIAVLTGQVAKLGWIYILQFTALLSINLAIINILPFPALDGGRLLFLGIEKIKGRPVRRELEALIHNIGFILLMVLILFVTFKDVARYGQAFRAVWDRIAS